MEQLALREFLIRGHFETHLNRMRVYYRAKRKALVEALAPLEHSMRIIGEAAGHHLTLQSKTGRTESELCQLALDHGVRVYPISPYFMGPCPYDGKVLLGFADPSARQLRAGAAAWCEAWKKNAKTRENGWFSRVFHGYFYLITPFCSMILA